MGKPKQKNRSRSIAGSIKPKEETKVEAPKSITRNFQVTTQTNNLILAANAKVQAAQRELNLLLAGIQAASGFEGGVLTGYDTAKGIASFEYPVDSKAYDENGVVKESGTSK